MDPRFLTTEARVLPGYKRPVAITTPAAGANWTVTVPGGRMWRPIAINATLVTSAAVANRIPGIQFQIYGVTTYVNDNSTAITASTTRTLVYQQGSVMVPTLQFTTFN